MNATLFICPFLSAISFFVFFDPQLLNLNMTVNTRKLKFNLCLYLKQPKFYRHVLLTEKKLFKKSVKKKNRRHKKQNSEIFRLSMLIMTPKCLYSLLLATKASSSSI